MSKKIILVEDDGAIVDIYSTIMQKNGFDVSVCYLGMDFLEKIKSLEESGEEKPDIILLDLILPDINGVEILYKIRNNKFMEGVKVFILTNQENPSIPMSGSGKPEKVIIKANITPTDLVKIIKKELK